MKFNIILAIASASADSSLKSSSGSGDWAICLKAQDCKTKGWICCEASNSAAATKTTPSMICTDPE